MKMHILMAGAAVLAFATGAIAQDAAAPATPDTTTSTTDATASGAAAPDASASTGAVASTAPATDAASAAAAAPAPEPGMTVPQTAAAAPTADPAKAQAADQMIAQNWSKYDKANTGQLTPLEFGTWVMAAQGNDMSTQVEKSRQSRAANLPATKILNATATEFSKADANKDQKVSQEELRAYLAA